PNVIGHCHPKASYGWKGASGKRRRAAQETVYGWPNSFYDSNRMTGRHRRGESSLPSDLPGHRPFARATMSTVQSRKSAAPARKPPAAARNPTSAHTSPVVGDGSTNTNRDRFLAACGCRPTDRPPIWLMRQAGRALPEYRALKTKHSFLEMVQTPELAAEVTL